jgi:hypothetical protein
MTRGRRDDRREQQWKRADPETAYATNGQLIDMCVVMTGGSSSGSGLTLEAQLTSNQSEIQRLQQQLAGFPPQAPQVGGRLPLSRS